MESYKQRILEVENHFHQNDLSLGYRRLIDLVLDAGQLSFYHKILGYSDFFYGESSTDDSKKERGLQLIKELKESSSPTPKSGSLLISADQVEKVYASRSFQLHPITFQLKSREIVGLVGENGNGKTTLLRIIAGELKPTSGNLNYPFINDLPYTFDWKTRLVYVPQRIEVLYGTLMDNLQFTLSAYNIKGEENWLLAQVMLARLGLWTYRNLQWSQLSSGYKMRFELVRNLLRRPELLLLDEPLANLDIMAQQIILEDLKYLAQSISHPFGVILSSQQLYEVEKVATNILFLEEGKLRNQEDKEEIEEELTIVEIDVNNQKEELLTVLNNLNLIDLKFNGGSYVAYFPKEISMHQVLNQLGNSVLEIKYVRDISASSRRFFVN